VECGREFNLAEHKASPLSSVPVFYSGPIDRLFNYQYGELPWRSLAFEQEKLDMVDYQGTSVVNYTEAEIPYTRIHEFKHYHPEDKAVMSCSKTVIMREYPRPWKSGDEPYYPVNNPQSQALLEKYQAEAAKVQGLVVGGRLGEYRYYDMDQSVGKALEISASHI
jgi:UDP-galactopyranose mutase